MDRAVSDVLGYILIFSLILGSVALVSAAGYSGLDSVRDTERFDNAQQVFEILDANVDDHRKSGVPSRGTEIRLADAKIAFGDPVRFNVSVDGYGYNRTVVDPLVYTQSSNRQILYSGGATIRFDRGYSRLVDGPPFRFGDETMLTLVQTRARDSGISGSGRVMVRSSFATESIHSYRGSGPYTVTLNVTTDHPSAWSRWLDSEVDGGTCEVLGETTSCTFDTGTVHIRTVTVDVHLE